MSRFNPVNPCVEGRRHVGVLPAGDSQDHVVTMLAHLMRNQPPAVEC